MRPAVTRLAPSLHLLQGAVNTGVLVEEGAGLLFDCCDCVTPRELAGLGVSRVEMICATQYRRVNVAGVEAFAQAALVAPGAEAELLARPQDYWQAEANRWHVYHARPAPLLSARPLRVSRAVGEGDVLRWRGYEIRVLQTPGMTDGSVSYLVEVGGVRVCFCGDLLCGPGQVWDLHSLQQGYSTHDYHGFLGARRQLQASLRRLAACGADLLVPAHGEPVHAPAAATELVCQRLDALFANYARASAMHFYFPKIMREQAGEGPMLRGRRRPFPGWLQPVEATSFAVVAGDRSSFLVDCGSADVVWRLRSWLDAGRVTGVDFAWITHYHDDHVSGLAELRARLGTPLATDEHLAEVIEHPARFFLPCQEPAPNPVARTTVHGETWRWREFELTALHFPGQTLYHSGLLVAGPGCRVLLAGDSLSPTGLDDYCPGNRVFTGPGRGMDRCLQLVEELHPDLIVNQHQDQGFTFTPEQVRRLRDNLRERRELLDRILPWEHPDFGLDPWWARAYPYEQRVRAGGRFRLEVRLSNHASQPAAARAELVPLPWLRLLRAGSGCLQLAPAGEGAIAFELAAAADTPPGTHILPARITLNGRYLGAIAHAAVQVG